MQISRTILQCDGFLRHRTGALAQACGLQSTLTRLTSLTGMADTPILWAMNQQAL
jgi:hypothetical protein